MFHFVAAFLVHGIISILQFTLINCSSWPIGYHNSFWHQSSVITALLEDNSSPDNGCCTGCTEILWHTSVIRFAVMSLISLPLCGIMGNPPVVWAGQGMLAIAWFPT